MPRFLWVDEGKEWRRNRNHDETSSTSEYHVMKQWLRIQSFARISNRANEGEGWDEDERMNSATRGVIVLSYSIA